MMTTIGSDATNSAANVDPAAEEVEVAAVVTAAAAVIAMSDVAMIAVAVVKIGRTGKLFAIIAD